MKIDREKCAGCEACYPYCTVGAIRAAADGDQASEIDQDECVECGACLRSDICPADAIYQQELGWPRILRAHFSDPVVRHPITSMPGRGTEEVKTNDVTGRIGPGEVLVGIELGRPGLGARLRDLEKISMALSRLGGIEYEPKNPVTVIMADTRTGKLKDEVLDEKVLSAIIEFKIEMGRLEEVLKTLREMEGQIETVFSLDLACCVNRDGSIPSIPVARACGFSPRPNTKTNVGLGRP